MGKIKENIVAETMKKFRKKKVMEINEIEKMLSCSLITVRRYLKQWQTITSYNFNGKYYVLSDVPKFDDNGLWKYQTIRFSKRGNLIQTIVYFVENSPAGLEAPNIFNILGFDSHVILSELVKKSLLQRKKIAGAFVYFSSNHDRFNVQFGKREEVESRKSLIMPSDNVGISILVERIKHPGSDLQILSQHLQKQGIKVSVEGIGNFLTHHGIQKKTLHSAQW